MNRYIAYYRVSTDKQGSSGLGLETQQAAVREHLNGASWELLDEVVEVESGKRNNRPQLLQALSMCKLKGATLVIAKLDRLSRNVAFLANLMETDVNFICCDMPHATPLTLHIMAAVAQDERERISQRTKAALAVAKARGVILGNPQLKPGTRTTADNARRYHQSKSLGRAIALKPVIHDIRGEGKTSLRQITGELNFRGFKTPRGKEWQANSVRNLLLMIEEQTQPNPNRGHHIP